MIELTPKSEELFQLLTTIPPNLEKAERFLREENLSPREVTKIGICYVGECFCDAEYDRRRRSCLPIRCAKGCAKDFCRWSRRIADRLRAGNELKGKGAVGAPLVLLSALSDPLDFLEKRGGDFLSRRDKKSPPENDRKL